MKKKLFLILCLLGAIEMSSFNLIKNDGISVMATNCTNDDRSSYILAVITMGTTYPYHLPKILERLTLKSKM